MLTISEQLVENIRQLEKSKEKIYSVWVGASEVNDYYLSLEDAIELAHEYEEDGYYDVVIRAERGV